jgi:hypothetical protein
MKIEVPTMLYSPNEAEKDLTHRDEFLHRLQEQAVLMTDIPMMEVLRILNVGTEAAQNQAPVVA